LRSIVYLQITGERNVRYLKLVNPFKTPSYLCHKQMKMTSAR